MSELTAEERLRRAVRRAWQNSMGVDGWLTESEYAYVVNVGYGLFDSKYEVRKIVNSELASLRRTTGAS